MKLSLPVPGYRRTRLVRRLAAGMLLAVAVFLFAFQKSDNIGRPVAVTTTHVDAGRALTAKDFTVVAVPLQWQPDQAIKDAEPLVGRIAAVDLYPGRMLTPGDLVDAQSVADGKGKMLVPILIADPALCDLLRHGDEVTVIASGGGAPVVVATGADVVTAGAGTHKTAVLLAVDRDQAKKVAAAALGGPLSLVVTGARAG